MNNWSTAPLNEVCEHIVDCVNKTAPVVEYATPYKMIRTSNVKEGKILLDNVRYVSKEVFKKWSRRLELRKNDVILTREAPLGEIGLLRDPKNIFLGQRLMIYRANPEKLYQLFLYYSFQDSYLQGQIRGLGSGSTVEHIRVPDAERLLIELPPLTTQRRIADILSAYDDLIENNQRRIAILEKMAQNLYQEWFVRLRFPGHEQVKVVDGVPERWEKTIFTKVVNINPRYSLNKKGALYPYVDMGGLSENSMIVECETKREVASGSRFMNDDVLFARITPCLENGKTGYVQFLDENQVGIGSTEFIVFKEKVMPSEMIYLLSRTKGFRENAINSMSGASGRQRVDIACFGQFSFLLPPKSLMDSFSSTV
ncbi:MAG: restriction endonuclease subunit S, partial [Saprospiraceae bacterium]|nr:restriction endonuclease subunit S [Saprospiraceae bacterium]